MGVRNVAAAAAMAISLAGFASARPALGASGCPVPGADWQQVEPEAMGMDSAKLQEALDYGTANLGFAVRVYRRGCLVGADRAEPINDKLTLESYSMAKSVTSLLFGRAMTLGLISADDPVGSLVPEADGPHGEITMLDLLTMSSGLRWNGFRDYNIFTIRDRVRDALTLPIAHEHGTYFEYAQSAVALLVKAIERATGEDPVDFLQRELMTPIGIDPGDWRWQRDKVGNVQGFFGVSMTADDYARLGELLRRGGVWGGRRLLSREYVERATSPSATNGCYGWLVWVNAGAPCISATILDRTVDEHRDFPDLPADMYNFSGLFGQHVTVFPSQEIVIVRLGQDPQLAFTIGESWPDGLYRRVLASVTDQPIEVAPPATPTRTEPDTDYGFQTALLEPGVYSKGADPDPLPPAGPERARAIQLKQIRGRVARAGDLGIRLRLSCPHEWPGPGMARCMGSLALGGDAQGPAIQTRRYSLRAGSTRTLTVSAPARAWRRYRKPAGPGLGVTAINRDRADGTPAHLALRLPKNVSR